MNKIMIQQKEIIKEIDDIIIIMSQMKKRINRKKKEILKEL